MKYSLSIRNGYSIIEIDGKSYMLDTGAPCCVSALAGLTNVVVNGKAFPMMFHPNARMISRGAGMCLAGLIGADVVRAFGGVFCDLKRGVATFGPVEKRSDGVTVRFDHYQEYRVSICVNGRTVDGFLDTGAPRTVVKDDTLLDRARPRGVVDEATLYGIVPMNAYEGELEFGGMAVNALTLQAAPILPLGREIKAYFSPATFARRYYAIDLTRKEVCFD